MKLLLGLIVASALALALPGATPTGPAPPHGEVRLSIPGTGHELSVAWRQLGPDVDPFRVTEGMSAPDLRRLQVQAVLAQGGSLSSDVPLLIGGRTLPAGRHPIGFTVDVAGPLHFFLVEGQEAWPLADTRLEAGWESPRLLMQLAWDGENGVDLVWHFGEVVGRVPFVPILRSEPR